MTRAEDHEGSDPPPDPHPHTWLELQRRFDQIDTHVRDLRSTVKEFDNRVKEVEITLARGARFPPWAGGIVTALVVQIGTTVWWASGINASVQGLPDLEQRLTSAFQGMRNSEAVVTTIQGEHLRMRQELDNIQRRTIEGTDDRWRKRDDEARMAEFQRYLDSEIKRIEERIGSIDSKVVGRGDAGWHRADHNSYAEMVEHRFKAVENNLSSHERRNVERDSWWRQLWSSGVIKEGRGSSSSK